MFCYCYFASSFADALLKTLNSPKQLIGYFDAFLKKIIHRESEKKKLNSNPRYAIENLLLYACVTQIFCVPWQHTIMRKVSVSSIFILIELAHLESSLSRPWSIEVKTRTHVLQWRLLLQLRTAMGWKSRGVQV
jgi:hypothetical protein